MSRVEDLVVVRGTVIGDAGAAVAGWVSLGKRSPQRWISQVVRIATDDGREITLDGLGAESLTPVSTEAVKWRDLEGKDLAQLCSREAPAPDVEVDFRSAVLRGGEPVVAWGEPTEHGYAGSARADGSDVAGDAGDPFRGTVERAVTRLAARVVAIGSDREALFERTRDKLIEKQRAADAARAKQAAAPKQRAAATPAGATPDPDYTNRIAWNLPLWIALGAITAITAIAAGLGATGAGLRAGAMIAFVPLALDAVVVPRFRQGTVAPPSLEIPLIGFLLAASGVMMTSYAVAVGDGDPARSTGLRIGGYVLATIATAALTWLWAATRTRRSWVAMMVHAPPHTQPMREGIWGALDGAFSSEVMSIGAHAKAFGAATKDAAGIRSRSVSTEGFAKLTAEAPLRAGDGVHDVRLADAAILTMARFERSTGKDSSTAADVINGRTPVRVVGRVRDGRFEKGGEASLLVFAAGVGTDVDRELRRLHLRQRIAMVLAALGVAALVTSFTL